MCNNKVVSTHLSLTVSRGTEWKSKIALTMKRTAGNAFRLRSLLLCCFFLITFCRLQTINCSYFLLSFWPFSCVCTRNNRKPFRLLARSLSLSSLPRCFNNSLVKYKALELEKKSSMALKKNFLPRHYAIENCIISFSCCFCSRTRVKEGGREWERKKAWKASTTAKRFTSRAPNLNEKRILETYTHTKRAGREMLYDGTGKACWLAGC